MESLSEINLPNQILSIAVAGGLVAFGFLILRIVINIIKSIINKVQFSKANDKSSD